jgi:hypothetical protein
VLYVSGEESERQIKLRGERLAVEAKNVFLLPETNLENIIMKLNGLSPARSSSIRFKLFSRARLNRRRDRCRR